MDHREMARMGGRARQAAMSPAERQKLIKKASKAAAKVRTAQAAARKKKAE
jgi:hypothetical protein